MQFKKASYAASLHESEVVVPQDFIKSWLRSFSKSISGNQDKIVSLEVNRSLYLLGKK